MCVWLCISLENPLGNANGVTRAHPCGRREWHLALLRVIGAANKDHTLIGAIGEAFRCRHGIQHRQIIAERIGAGPVPVLWADT